MVHDTGARSATAVPFFDLARQLAAIRPEIEAALASVLDDGGYTNGPAVAAFEEQFARYCGVSDCIAVNNGTSALHLALRALGIGPGDEVVTVSMSFVATAWPILYTGARPVFVDVDPATMLMDAAALRAAITPRTRAVIVVHLYGRMADMDAILAAAGDVPVVEDCAQSQGATWRGRRAGSLGAIGCYSFYPSKNLGAYGEAGGVVTNDTRLAETCRRLRNHAMVERYLHEDVGYNYRMNSFQGAVLQVKLRHLEEWTERRIALARRYDRLLEGVAVTPPAPAVPDDARAVQHLYVVRHPRRDALRSALQERGVETAVHYPRAIHQQPVLERYGFGVTGDLRHTEAVARDCISLPLYPEMPEEHVDRVAAALRETAGPSS